MKRNCYLLVMMLIVSIMAGCPKAPTPPATFSLTITVTGNGTVSSNPSQETYETGSMVGLTAKADSGWKFSRWENGLSGTFNPTLIQMDDNKTVKAVFVKNSSGEGEGEGETSEGEGEGHQPRPATVHIVEQTGGFIATLDAGDIPTSELWADANDQTQITKITAVNKNGQKVGEVNFSGSWPVSVVFTGTDKVKFEGVEANDQSHGWVVE